MNEPRILNRASQQLVIVGLMLACIFVRLLPMHLLPEGWPGPDLMFCLLMACVLRRPDLVPLWIVAPLFLFADFMLMHPPGLRTLLVIFMLEALHSRRRHMKTISPVAEIFTVALLAAALVFATWFVQMLVLVPQPGLSAQLAQVPLTMTAYPCLVLLCRFVLNIRRRPAPEGFGRGARA